jgi:pseudolysin
MKKNHVVTPVVFCLGFVSFPASAATPIFLQKTSFEQLQNSYQIVLSKNQLTSSSTKLPNALHLIGQHTDTNLITHKRLQQKYKGFPVFGGYAIIHGAQTMNGVVYDGLNADIGEPDASFVDNADHALGQFKEQYSTNPISEATAVPMVYIDEKHQAFWAYKVSLLVTPLIGGPARPTAILDAKTMKPFEQWNDLKTAGSIVQGMGYGGNAKTGKYLYAKELPFLTITRDDATSVCSMENTDVKVVDMLHLMTGPKSAMQFDCLQSELAASNTFWTGMLGNGYDRKNGGYSPSNDALYAGQVIKDLYKKWYDVEVLTKLNKPMPLIMRVHYGSGYENAYWDSKQMTFGDGGRMMYPLVSVGIGAHEVSHGFTEQHSNLQYFGQSGGMNEAFSDMAAQAAEYYSNGTSSWLIGAEIMKEASGWTALRFLELPSKDGASIDSADQYHKGIDVHHSSGVYNRFFYILAHQAGWSVKDAFHVMVKANMDYWTPYTTFNEGACGVLSAAEDLGLADEAIKYAFEQVSVNYSKCA